MKARHFALALACSLTFTAGVFADTPPAADAPEPLMKERIHISELIDQARKKGIGVQSYVVQMEAIEDRVFAGASQAELKSSITALTAKLNEQLQQSEALKYYKPTAPTAAQRRDRNEEEHPWRGDSEAAKRASAEEKYRSTSRYNGSNSLDPHDAAKKDRRSDNERSMQTSNYAPTKSDNFTVSNKVNLRAPTAAESARAAAAHSSFVSKMRYSSGSKLRW